MEPSPTTSTHEHLNKEKATPRKITQFEANNLRIRNESILNNKKRMAYINLVCARKEGEKLSPVFFRQRSWRVLSKHSQQTSVFYLAFMFSPNRSVQLTNRFPATHPSMQVLLPYSSGYSEQVSIRFSNLYLDQYKNLYKGGCPIVEPYQLARNCSDIALELPLLFSSDHSRAAFNRVQQRFIALFFPSFSIDWCCNT